jgi:hypothetical protein
MARDIPIIFSAAMVRAFLREVEAPGTGKTMTRRLARQTVKTYPNGRKTPPVVLVERDSPWKDVKPGDRLWIRENVTRFDKGSCDQHVWYWAGKNAPYANIGPDSQWPAGIEGPGGGAPYSVPCIHMPRWASRITLTVISTKIEHLQEISEDDAMAEGIRRVPDRSDGFGGGWRYLNDLGLYRGPSPIFAFADLWDNLHGKGAWDVNPVVVAFGLKPIKANIDAPEARAA